MQSCKKPFFAQDCSYVRRIITHIFVLYLFGLDEMKRACSPGHRCKNMTIVLYQLRYVYVCLVLPLIKIPWIALLLWMQHMLSSMLARLAVSSILFFPVNFRLFV